MVRHRTDKTDSGHQSIMVPPCAGGHNDAVVVTYMYYIYGFFGILCSVFVLNIHQSDNCYGLCVNVGIQAS